MTRLCNNICTSVPWQTLQAANKVKAIWRLSELLTTKLPTGTFPVKGDELTLAMVVNLINANKDD
uniref:Ankyrin repeat domain-containing protein n=1 Tax=Zea mays TaxID=4577 RepID=B4G0A8_MAIZE|nr:unknown [Zea mays]